MNEHNKDYESLARAFSEVRIREANGLDANDAEWELVRATLEQMRSMDISEFAAQDARLEEELARLVPDPGEPSLALFYRYYRLQQKFLDASPDFLSDAPCLEMLSFIWSKLQWISMDLVIKQDIPDTCNTNTFGAADYRSKEFWAQDHAAIRAALRTDTEEVGRLIWGGDLSALKHATATAHYGFFHAEMRFNFSKQ